ncbi:uncharacterized protein LOC131856771 [Cryptomeria japonica]|uniref:uncharacterized protein LOC131856771 n=1 Tax=Cryptomeria japonica TaxID=3369 RepID=UPI0027DA4D53|nr:uncharacterized protein LOC131856771 [Cryptomeria japonica]
MDALKHILKNVRVTNLTDLFQRLRGVLTVYSVLYGILLTGQADGFTRGPVAACHVADASSSSLCPRGGGGAAGEKDPARELRELAEAGSGAGGCGGDGAAGAGAAGGGPGGRRRRRSVDAGGAARTDAAWTGRRRGWRKLPGSGGGAGCWAVQVRDLAGIGDGGQNEVRDVVRVRQRRRPEVQTGTCTVRLRGVLTVYSVLYGILLTGQADGFTRGPVAACHVADASSSSLCPRGGGGAAGEKDPARELRELAEAGSGAGGCGGDGAAGAGAAGGGPGGRRRRRSVDAGGAARTDAAWTGRRRGWRKLPGSGGGAGCWAVQVRDLAGIGDGGQNEVRDVVRVRQRRRPEVQTGTCTVSKFGSSRFAFHSLSWNAEVNCRVEGQSYNPTT